MRRLSFIQTGLAGVNHVPLNEIPPEVTLSSNAGGYSDEVGEHAWGLLLSGAKRIVRLTRSIEYNSSKSPVQLGRDVVVLKGRRLGILGYGGIGRVVARFGLAFGMKVTAMTRSEEGKRMVDGREVDLVWGRQGLEDILKVSDAVVVALPLNNETRGMVGKDELRIMKKDTILVNVGRAEIIDQHAIYSHLAENRDFFYATDVWWTKQGKELYPPELPFFELPNFVGTPHVSGPSAVASGRAVMQSVENVLRYLNGEPVMNVVKRSDYL